jgi:hypothetical protein
LIVADFHKAEAQLCAREKDAHLKVLKQQRQDLQDEQKTTKKRKKMECMLQVGHLTSLSNNVGDSGVRTILNSTLHELQLGSPKVEVLDLTATKSITSDRDTNPIFSVRGP